MSNARIIEISNDAYHADTSAISHSGLDLVLRDPALYYYERLSRERPAERSEALEFGSKFHDALLHPGCFANNVVTIPNNVLGRGGQRSGTMWQQFKELYPGKVLLKQTEPMMSMIRSIESHDGARRLFELAQSFETTIFWRDDEFDVDRKARLDMLLFPKLKIIADLKSTSTDASPAACAFEAAKYGYHRQQEFYKDACEQLYGERLDFVFIFVSKEPPHRCTVVRLPNRWVEVGIAQNRRGLKTYAECLKTGRWLPEDHGQVIDVDCPPSVERSTEWSVEANG